ncbi:hypothetical protein FB451DRAFT_1387350 [Mycena latifolia]|nr:hypothetical protein FB451DRAFT_1387350 [Mycena latifolia]
MGSSNKRVNPVDCRSFDLPDDEAFDNPPPDDLSDAEADDEPHAPILIMEAIATEIPASPGIHLQICVSVNVLRWIFSG